MAPQVDSDHEKDGADVYNGSEIGSENCRKKIRELLELVGLPNGLILLDDIQEYGYVEETGFVWMKWKVKHEFKAIGRLVQYDTQISGYKMKEMSGVERKKLREWINISEISIDDSASAKKGVSGVKNKELSEWITISEISINDPASAKICFKSDIGKNKSIPVGPFQIEESSGVAIRKG